MSYRTAIKQAIANDTVVQGIVGTRVYWLRAPMQTLVDAYVILVVISETQEPTLAGNVALTNIRLQVSMFGEKYTDLQELDLAIRDALASVASFSSLHIYAHEMFEDDVRLYHLISEFSIWYQ